MASVQELLNKARSQLGVREDPPGSNMVLYASWAGIPGQAWCAAFVSWCFFEVGMPVDVPQFVWCPSGVQMFKDKGRWGSVPQIGAVVFFQWAGISRPCHVGIVEAVRDDGSIVTIEGNTDSAGGGSGGRVMRQVRRANIVGYGYPNYQEIAPKVPMIVAPKPMLKIGSRGPLVTELQRKLGHLATDGIFGPLTDRAVRTFQRTHGLVQDGIVGPKTWAALG